MAIDLTVNGVRYSVDVAPETPLLWVIRDQLGLTGTKFSCGIAQCGACTLHIDGRPVRSCSVPVSAASATVRGPNSRRFAASSALLAHQPPVIPQHPRLPASQRKRRPEILHRLVDVFGSPSQIAQRRERLRTLRILGREVR